MVIQGNSKRFIRKSKSPNKEKMVEGGYFTFFAIKIPSFNPTIVRFKLLSASLGKGFREKEVEGGYLSFNLPIIS